MFKAKDKYSIIIIVRKSINIADPTHTHRMNLGFSSLALRIKITNPPTPKRYNTIMAIPKIISFIIFVYFTSIFYQNMSNVITLELLVTLVSLLFFLATL